MKWISTEAHKVIINNLYYGEKRTEVFVARRLLAFYLDIYYDVLSPEFFYTINNALIKNSKISRNEIEWII